MCHRVCENLGKLAYRGFAEANALIAPLDTASAAAKFSLSDNSEEYVSGSLIGLASRQVYKTAANIVPDHDLFMRPIRSRPN
jgi:hypothetical protein